MDDQKTSSDKWWTRWWKQNYTDPLNPDSLTFFPGINFIADKLGIESYKGFALLIVVLIFIAIFFA